MTKSTDIVPVNSFSLTGRKTLLVNSNGAPMDNSSALPVQETAPALFTTAYTLSVSAAVATGDGAALNVRNYSKIGVQIIIADTATVQLWGSLDAGTTYSQILEDAAGTDISSGTTATAFTQLAGKWTHVRAKVSAWTSGAVSVHILAGN